MIAAISIVNRSALATRNIADFRAIPELELLNPWDFRCPGQELPVRRQEADSRLQGFSTGWSHSKPGRVCQSSMSTLRPGAMPARSIRALLLDRVPNYCITRPDKHLADPARGPTVKSATMPPAAASSAASGPPTANARAGATPRAATSIWPGPIWRPPASRCVTTFA
jgi:hypothetical protein